MIDRLKAKLLGYPNKRDAAFIRSLRHLYEVDRRWKSRGSAAGLPLGNYFEFGVWNGKSMEVFWKTLGYAAARERKDWRLFGFDSFEGLPEPEGAADAHPIVGKGAFKSSGLDRVAGTLAKAGIPAERLKLVPGFYENSLTPELKASLGNPPACFVNIDVDYYSSTMTVLTWIESLLFDGSIVYFDDVLFYNGNPHKGQIRAIAEFNESRTESGLYQERGLDPLGRVYVYWKNDAAGKSEKLQF